MNSKDAVGAIKFSLDSLLIRDNRMFGYGWIFHETIEIKSMRLVLLLKNARVVSLPVGSAKQRDDVATAFPGYRWARFSGYLFYVAWKGPRLAKMQLEGILANGESFIQPLTTNAEAAVESDSTSGKGRLPGIAALLGVVLHAAKQFKCKVLNLLRWAAGDLPLLSGIDEIAIQAIRSELSQVDCIKCALIIDHDLGGGANHYREKLIAQRLINDRAVILLTYEVQTLRYVMELRTKDQKQRFMLDGMAIAVHLANRGLIREVFYNDGVSFPRPDEIPQLLVKLRKAGSIYLTIALHDYFAVCPSQFLLNAEGKYCGIPDNSECQRCLPINGEGFATLFTSGSILNWRKKWRRALIAADEIICFSNSSKTLIKRAYPMLDDQRVLLIPHPVEQGVHRAPRIALSPGLHVGVVGSIGIHKGAAVIKELASAIATLRLPIRITVFGSIELACQPAVVNVTGPYSVDELPLLIEKSGANIFVVPSICPETFSYVTQELMAMSVPVVCFDLGAPAERVSAYDLGLVLPLTSATQLLDNLIKFHFELLQKTRLQRATS